MNKRKSVQIADGHTVTVDAEDAERVSQQTWRILFSDAGRELFVTTVGSGQSKPVEQLLGGYILGVKPSQYVEQAQRGNDYRKSNLKVYQSKAVAIARLS